MSQRRHRYIDEPTMSDKTLLLNVEDLINVAFGSSENNIVDFKLMQTILHILARQMRLLEQDVEIKFAEDEVSLTQLQKLGERSESETSSDEKGAQKDSAKVKKRALKGKDDKKLDKDDKKSKKDEKTVDKHEKKLAKDKTVDTTASKGKDSPDRRTDSPEKQGKEKDKKTEGRQRSPETDKKKQSEVDDDKRSKKGGQGKKGGVTVTEEVRKRGRGDKDKILIVEKGPTTRDSRTRVGSIEVVTRSEFDQLESAVEDLVSLKGPLPMPTMPDNKKLKSALVKGTASLPDTMEALQVNARVQAAEQALTRMAGLLTQLAAAGAIPPELSDMIDQINAEVQELSFVAQAGRVEGPGSAIGTRKSVFIDPLLRRDSAETTAGRRLPGASGVSGVISGEAFGATSSATLAAKVSASVASRKSTVSQIAGPVTHRELDEALQQMKTELLSNISNITAKDSSTAERANTIANSVADKLDVALKLDSRISDLYSLTNDYAQQLSGFDSGVATQMQSFQEQMMQMRLDLKGGLNQLEAANNNSETTAVAELRSSYEMLVTELDTTLHTHNSIVILQNQLSDELRGLIEWVEMLREQKADRDEVIDGLRDKADLNRLNGLLNVDAFEVTRNELDKRIDVCYEKFHKQDFVWMGALKDLSNIAGTKAELTQLMSLRDFATDILNQLRETINKLEIMLGEPKAALTMRQISRGAHCGACLVPALIPPLDAHYGAPAPLPPLPLHDHRPPVAEPCIADVKMPAPPDAREHVCHRWVGGSHTLMSEHVTRERAQPVLDSVPTRRYTGYGSDGRLYKLAEELQPCVECNQVSTDKPEHGVPPSEAGDGDHNRNIDVEITCTETMDDEDEK